MVFNDVMESIFVFFVMFMKVSSIEKFNVGRSFCRSVSSMPFVKGNTYTFLYIPV